MCPTWTSWQVTWLTRRTRVYQVTAAAASAASSSSSASRNRCHLQPLPASPSHQQPASASQPAVYPQPSLPSISYSSRRCGPPFCHSLAPAGFQLLRQVNSTLCYFPRVCSRTVIVLQTIAQDHALSMKHYCLVLCSTIGVPNCSVHAAESP